MIKKKCAEHTENVDAIIHRTSSILQRQLLCRKGILLPSLSNSNPKSIADANSPSSEASSRTQRRDKKQKGGRPDADASHARGGGGGKGTAFDGLSDRSTGATDDSGFVSRCEKCQESEESSEAGRAGSGRSPLAGFWGRETRPELIAVA